MHTPLRQRSPWLGFRSRGRQRTRLPSRCHRPPRLVLAVETLEDRAVPSFAAPINYDAGTNVTALATGDFNGDGIPDLVTVTTDPSRGRPALAVLLGNGDGTFQPPQLLLSGSFGPLAVGAFTGNHHLDVAVLDQRHESVQILLGNGDGTFEAAQSYAIGRGEYPVGLATGDLTGDGRDDLVVSHASDSQFPGPSAVSVFRSNADGTFQTPITYAIGTGVGPGLAVADFSGDGQPDIAVTAGSGGSVRVLLGNGDGTFQVEPFTYALGVGSTNRMAVGEFNGYPGLVTANAGDDSVSILLNTGTWPAVAAHRKSGAGAHSSQYVVARDPSAAWSLAATPRKDPALRDGTVLPTRSDGHAERTDDSRPANPVGNEAATTRRSPGRLAAGLGGDAWAGPAWSLTAVSDEMLASLIPDLRQ